MAFIHSSIEDGSSSPLDPWDWGVEEVVAALCDSNSLLRNAHPTRSFPEEAKLATKLRELDVSGMALLKNVDDECLKRDFSITSMGHRASLEDLIEILQFESTKYQTREARRTSSIATKSHMGWISRMATPFNSPFHQSGHPPGTPLPWQSPRYHESGLLSPQHETEGYTKERKDTLSRNLLAEVPPLPNPDWPTPQTLITVEGFRTPEINTSDMTSSMDGNAPSKRQFGSTIEAVEAAAMAMPQNIIDDSGRERKKRIAPTLLSPLAFPAKSNVVPDAKDPTIPAQGSHDRSSVEYSGCHTLGSPEIQPSLPRQDSFSNGRLDQAVGTLELPEPGLIYIDKHGRKKVMPISQPTTDHTSEARNIVRGGTVESTIPCSTFNEDPHTRIVTLGKKAQRRPDQLYLGHQILGVDELFYGDTELDGILREPDQADSSVFSFVYRDDACQGQKIYVHTRIKHFLQAQPIRLSSPAQNIVGIVPYPNRIGRKRQPLSMTVFSKGANNEAVARRLKRSEYIEDQSAQSPNGLAQALNVFQVADPCMAVDDLCDQDWKGLEKWKYIDSNDEILPVYGDSGSEGEYDMDTWKEMEKDGNDMRRPKTGSKKPSLSDDIIEDAINKAIESIVREWQVTRRPKLQPKAWRIWARAKRDRTRQHETQRLEDEIQKLNNRIVKLRKNIAAEHWSNSDRLIRQCKSLQPSIFHQLTLKWQQEILQLVKAPRKIASKPKKLMGAPAAHAETGPVVEGEENVDSDDGSSCSAEDSLDDFIVSDYEDQADRTNDDVLDEELTLADVEDEVAGFRSVISKLIPAGTNGNSPDKSSDPEQNLLEISKTSDEHRSVRPIPDYIDLTQLSSDAEPVVTGLEQKGSSGVKTARVDDGSETDIWLPTKRVFNRPPTVSPRQDNIIDLDTSSDNDYDSALRTIEREKPPLDDIGRIAIMDPKRLVEQQDRKRLLIWTIEHTPPIQRSLAQRVLDEENIEFVTKHVLLALEACKSYRTRLRQFELWLSDGLMQLAAWYVSWTIPVKLSKLGYKPDHLETTVKEVGGFGPFYDFLLSCMKPYNDARSAVKVPPTSPRLVTPQKLKKQRIVRDRFTDERVHKPHGKRVYLVQESQETLAKRQSAQNRLQKDDERRQQHRREELLARRTDVGSSVTDVEVVLNPGKVDGEEYVYLDPKFGNGQFLKPHQIEGLQFLWREITADHDDLQGCLLAHTMGLGKTIQVIALMVALAGASQSLKETVRQQVPPSLQQSQTLILCPPALVENWWDELFMWVPESGTDTIGPIRMVNTAKKLDQRVKEILSWNDNGGVLLMAYSSFADLIMNRKNKKGIAPLKEEDHHKVKMALLSRTNLVIADEAHEFKNQAMNLSRCMTQIRTKSRIALTGSPLSNNLQEYFALIDWISPEFLGTATEFRATYEEPIHEGLYQDSSNGEYRVALKRLKTLQLEMEPKVHRADFSVLHHALHGKMEFVIRLPLSDVQDKLYRIFVEVTLNSIANREPQRAVLWTLLRLMQLLCHHPKLYHDRLQSLETELQAQFMATPATGTPKLKNSPKRLSPELTTALDDDEEALEFHPEMQSTLQRIITQSQTYLSSEAQDLADTSLSYKMQTLLHIVELSIKAGDKVLIFSHRPPALDYVAVQLERLHREFARIDGRVLPQKRQAITKSFNDGSVDVCLVSTKAGGVGLNLFGANRVIILDEWFNPMYEQQAIGRSYRIGQMKPVYVYRLTIAGTFEQTLQNQGLFKEQLATRVVDKRNPIRSAIKGAAQYVFEPKVVEQESVEQYKKNDVSVLGVILADRNKNPVLSITPTESFHVEDKVELTKEEAKEAEQMRQDEQLRRRDPVKYQELITKRSGVAWANAFPLSASQHSGGPQQFSAAFNIPNKGHPPSTAPAQPNAETHMGFGASGGPSESSRITGGTAEHTVFRQPAKGAALLENISLAADLTSSPRASTPKATTKTAFPQSTPTSISFASENTKTDSATLNTTSDLQSSQKYKKKKRNLELADHSSESQRSQKKRKPFPTIIEAGFKSGGQMETTFNYFLRQESSRGRDPPT